MRKRSAFTLIELLVVIAIIALLMSILMPALARVKKQAKLVIDQANLRQWGIIWYMFLEDNNGVAPEGLGWWLLLWTYYNDEDLLKGCPAAEKPLMDATRAAQNVMGTTFNAWSNWVNAQGWEEGEPPPDRPYAGSYGFNFWFSHSTSGGRDASKVWGLAPGSLLAAKGQDRVPMVLDCLRSGNTPLPGDIPPSYDGEVYHLNSGNVNEIRNFCINRHDGYINGVFLDGHARKIGLKELWVLRWHRTWMEDLEVAGWPTAWDEPDHWMYKFKDYNPFR